MANCKVQIKTITDGNENLFETDGMITSSENGRLITYVLDGDGAELVFSEAAMEMSRRGSVVLTARFCEGEGASFKIGGQNFQGELPLSTELYRYREEGNTLSALLEYSLVYPDHSQKFRLEFTILISEEK